MDQVRRFYAYSNYLVATSRLMARCHASDSVFASTMASMPGVAHIQRRSCGSIPRIAELLRNSWFTEVAISQALQFPDYLPYSNPWAMVQAYYAVYLAIRAYFHAFDRAVTPTHGATLSTASHDLVGIVDRFPEPWASVVQGDTKTRPITFSNSTYHHSLVLTSALNSPHSGDPWQHYLLFLKTTRDRQIKSAIDEWKRRNRRRKIRGRRESPPCEQFPPHLLF